MGQLDMSLYFYMVIHFYLVIAKEDNSRALSVGIALLPMQRPVSPMVSPNRTQTTCGRQQWFMLQHRVRTANDKGSEC